MDTEHLDLLVIGGPQELLAPGSALKIKQVTFSFEGLSGALQYIRLVDTVIVLPEKSIFASMPRIDHFEKFYSTGTRIRIPTPASSSEIENLSEPLLTETTSIPPIFVRLGLASFPLIDQDKEEESISSQVSSSLSLINKSTKKNAQRDFIKRAASEFFLEVMEACSVLVNGGGEVYMLFPRTKAEYTTDIKEVVKKIAPGIAMDWRQSWRERDNSEWSWLLHRVESDLYFSIDEGRFCELIDCGYHILDALPTADLIFIFLYSGSKYYLDDGVIDRSGARRVMVFRWGEGSFVLASDGSLLNIITRLDDKKAVPVLSQIPPRLPVDSEPSPDQKLGVEVEKDHKVISNATDKDCGFKAVPAVSAKKHKNVTLKEAARICDVHVSTIRNWEAGKHTPSAWPGRDDSVQLKLFSENSKAKKRLKKTVLQSSRHGNMDKVSHRVDTNERW